MQALKNLGTVLKSIGATYKNVVKISILLADINDYAAVNKVYFQYFPDYHPARTCYSVLAMPKNAKIEIESIAALGDLEEISG